VLESGTSLRVAGEPLAEHEAPVRPEQHFTQPPPRYTEASLVKALEEENIGRPSTYATIVSTITKRDYVEREGRSLKPTDLGMLVTKLLVEHFPDVFNLEFTAGMEEELDDIEDGSASGSTSRDLFATKDLESVKKKAGEIKKNLQGRPTSPARVRQHQLVKKFAATARSRLPGLF
jgi:DNA topoisomerase-1